MYLKRYFKGKSMVWGIVRGILIMGISYIILYPMLSKLSLSLMSETDVFDVSVRYIPRSISIKNYIRTFNAMNYANGFLNTFILTFTVSILQMTSCTIIGYGFARFKFKGSNILFGLVLLTLVVPPQLIMIPLYMNFRYFTFFGLLNEPGINFLGTYWPFILTALTGVGLKNGLYIYIMRQHFKGMPNSLEEAAYVDGASPIKTFLKIMLPGAIPVLVIVFLFSFVWQWNDNFLTVMYLQGNNLPLLSKSLKRLPAVYQNFHEMEFGQRASIPYTSAIMNAGMIMFIAPLLIIYSSLQRYFIESVQRTGIVG